MKKVCICVPCYNNEKTIERTLTSIINQTYKNVTIKIFDNKSTDKTVQIVREIMTHHNNMSLVINDANLGMVGNWNKILKNIDGEYFCLFHADDIYQKDIVAKQVSWLNENLDIDVLCTSAYIIDANDNVISEHLIPEKYIKDGLYGFDDVYQMVTEYGNFIIAPSAMYRSKIFMNNNFKFNKLFKYACDLDMFWELAYNHRIGFLKDKLINYRLYSDDSTTYRIAMKYRYTMHDDFMAVLMKHIASNNVMHLLDSVEFLKVKNKGLKEKMIKSYLCGDWDYAKKCYECLDNRVKYERMWLWKILLKYKLPYVCRRWLAFKRYKKFFAGNLDNVILTKDV